MKHKIEEAGGSVQSEDDKTKAGVDLKLQQARAE